MITISGMTLLNIIEACKLTKDRLFLVKNDMYGKIHINSTISTNSKLSCVQIECGETPNMIQWSFAFDLLANSETIKMIIPIMEYEILPDGIVLKDQYQFVIVFNSRVYLTISKLVESISNRLQIFDRCIIASDEEVNTFATTMKSMRSYDGSKFINIGGNTITMYANMLSINKDDTLQISYLPPYDNTILYIFRVRKKKAKLDLTVYILYLDMNSNKDTTAI